MKTSKLKNGAYKSNLSFLNNSFSDIIETPTSDRIMANERVIVKKELFCNNIVYSVSIPEYDQAIFLKPETVEKVIMSLNNLIKHKRLEGMISETKVIDMFKYFENKEKLENAAIS